MSSPIWYCNIFWWHFIELYVHICAEGMIWCSTTIIILDYIFTANHIKHSSFLWRLRWKKNSNKTIGFKLNILQIGQQCELVNTYTRYDLHDNNSHTQISALKNFHPISVYSNIAKAFEKIIKTKLILFLESNSLLFKYQFGFRRHRSTEQAIDNATKLIYTTLEDGKKCTTIYLDLAKALSYSKSR